MKFFLTPLFLVLQFTLGYAQYVILSGNVKNKETGQIEAGINIMDRQMQVGTVSDDWGNFKLLLSVRDTYQLEISALGYEVIKLNLTSSEVEKFQQIQIQNNPVQLENITIYSPVVHKNQPFSKLDIQLRVS